MTDAGDRVVDALAGQGGAAGRPGHVYVVGLPADPMTMSTRAVTLLASADLVVTHEDPTDPVLKIAANARIEHRPVGSTPRLPNGVVVRVTRDLPVHRTPGLLRELADLDLAGIPFELSPVPVDEPGLPTVMTAWRNRRALSGTKVLVLRTRDQASGLSAHIRSMGGTPVEAPTVHILPGDQAALAKAVEELSEGGFAAVCFTSTNGVDAIADAVEELGMDGRALARTRAIACVGPGTAARLWQRLGIRADRVSKINTGQGLADEFPEGRGRV